MGEPRSKQRELCVVALCAAAAASCGDESLGAERGLVRAALTTAGTRVLGFESVSDWTVTGGSKALSNEHTQGATSLKLTSTGYVSAKSAKVQGPLGATAWLAFDVLIPHLQTPNWNGQAEVKLNAPSKGIYGYGLPARQFTFPYTVFQAMSFPVPSSIVTKLNGSYSDLEITISLTGGAGDYFLDNLRFLSADPQGRPVAHVSAGEVLGFENWGAWISHAPAVVNTSGRVAQGEHSLSISNIGWTRLDSAPLPTPRNAAPPYVSFYLLLPSPQVNPYWFGAVDLLLSVPSAGLNDVAIGHQELTGLPLDSFQRITFPVPSSVQSVMSGTYPDLKFAVVLNVPQGQTGEYLLDHIWFHQDATPVDGPVPPSPEAVREQFEGLPVDPPTDPPPLQGSGNVAVQNVRSFITWASGARASQVKQGRQLAYAARDNTDIVNAFIAELDVSSGNLPRNLVVLSLIGELKTTAGEDLMLDILAVPLPAGALDSPAAMSVTGLQLKAVDCLAFTKTARSRTEVLRLAHEHPSRAVRMEAIRAYVDNYGPGGRSEVLAVARPDEASYVDAVHHRSEYPEQQTFDEQLQEYLVQHPEQTP